MMNDNKRFDEFVKQLNARGVHIQWMWEARRDGRKPSWPKHPADVGMIAFTGNGFQPSVLVAVVVEYDHDGFGLFIDGPTNSIADDVERIATPNKRAA